MSKNNFQMGCKTKYSHPQSDHVVKLMVDLTCPNGILTPAEACFTTKLTNEIKIQINEYFVKLTTLLYQIDYQR
jgi:hypothetical protein